MVQKKGVHFGNLKDIEGNASMMVRGNEEESAENDLYNLMRGNTVLMMTEESNSGSDSEEGETEEEAHESSAVAVPEEEWSDSTEDEKEES